MPIEEKVLLAMQNIKVPKPISLEAIFSSISNENIKRAYKKRDVKIRKAVDAFYVFLVMMIEQAYNPYEDRQQQLSRLITRLYAIRDAMDETFWDILIDIGKLKDRLK